MSELNAYKADVTIPVYGTIADAEVYLKDKADAAIAELKAENERLKKCEIWMKQHFYCEEVIACESAKNRRLKRALYNLRACYADMMQKRYIECKTDGWVHRVNKWIEVERRCLKKAEEYK